MGLWPWSKRKKVQAAGLLLVRAKFDAAQTTPDNRKHWANADYLSADAAAAPDVRRTLRNRARYEVANNSYARGIVLTLANDVIGTGPRLQTLADSAKANRTIEAEFARWAKAVGLPEKLRTMRQACAQDGEPFALLANNDKLRSPVKLDVRLIEALRGCQKKVAAGAGGRNRQIGEVCDSLTKTLAEWDKQYGGK